MNKRHHVLVTTVAVGLMTAGAAMARPSCPS